MTQTVECKKINKSVRLNKNIKISSSVCLLAPNGCILGTVGGNQSRLCLQPLLMHNGHK